jgi:hypothetical protein
MSTRLNTSTSVEHPHRVCQETLWCGIVGVKGALAVRSLAMRPFRCQDLHRSAPSRPLTAGKDCTGTRGDPRASRL